MLTERCQTWTQTKFHLCSLCSHSSIIPSKLHLSDCPVFHPTTRKIDNNNNNNKRSPSPPNVTLFFYFHRLPNYNNNAQKITALYYLQHPLISLFLSYLILSSLKRPIYIKVKNILEHHRSYPVFCRSVCCIQL